MLPAGPLPAPTTDTSGCSRRQFTNLMVRVIEKEKGVFNSQLYLVFSSKTRTVSCEELSTQHPGRTGRHSQEFSVLNA